MQFGFDAALRSRERKRESEIASTAPTKKELSASLCVFLCMPSPFKIRQTFVIRSLLPMQILQLHRDQTMLAHFYYYYYCDEFYFIRIYIECLSLSLCCVHMDAFVVSRRSHILWRANFFCWCGNDGVGAFDGSVCVQWWHIGKTNTNV